MSVEKQSSEEIRASGMKDDALVEEHVRLHQIKHEPTKGFLQAPLIFVFVFGCLIFLCSIQLAHTTNDFNLHPPQEPDTETPEQKEANRWAKKLSAGKKVFLANCSSCHKPNGVGEPGVYPPLAGSDWVSTDPALITNIILKGLKGEIKVNGETYGTTGIVMNPIAISDRQIANVVTYVRQAWGNEADPIEIFEDDVASVREDYSEKQDQWVFEQLKEIYPEALFGD